MHAVPSPVPRFACPSSRTSPRPCACDPSRLPILPSRRRQLSPSGCRSGVRAPPRPRPRPPCNPPRASPAALASRGRPGPQARRAPPLERSRECEREKREHTVYASTYYPYACAAKAAHEPWGERHLVEKPETAAECTTVSWNASPGTVSQHPPLRPPWLPWPPLLRASACPRACQHPPSSGA